MHTRIPRASHTTVRDLLAEATAIEQQLTALHARLGEIEAELARRKVPLRPELDRIAVVSPGGVVRLRRPVPQPEPPEHARELTGRALRIMALVVLRQAGRPQTVAEIHQALHQLGCTPAAPRPRQRLADALGSDFAAGRVVREGRGRYRLGRLSRYYERIVIEAGRIGPPAW